MDEREIIIWILCGCAVAFEEWFRRYRFRRLKKRILFNLLTDQRWEWRTLESLSRAIGDEPIETTKELLIEVGARQSTKDRAVWTLEPRG